MADQDPKLSPDYWEKLGPSPEKGYETGPWNILPSGGELDLGREAKLGASQLAIGFPGLAASAARGAWGLAHDLAPSYIGEVPARLYPSGPEGYGTAVENYLGIRPESPGERVYAGGMRSAGSAAPFGPRAMMVAGVGGALGQTATEMGYPRIGQAIDLASGLVGGYRGIQSGGWFGRSPAAPAAPAPAPNVPTVRGNTITRPGSNVVDMTDVFGAEGSNVVPFPRNNLAPAPVPRPAAAPAPAEAPAAAPAPGLTPAQIRAEARADQEAANVQRLVNMERIGPLTHGPLNWLTGGLGGTALNYWVTRNAAVQRAMQSSSVARRILGLGAGTLLGITSSEEQLPLTAPQ